MSDVSSINAMLSQYQTTAPPSPSPSPALPPSSSVSTPTSVDDINKMLNQYKSSPSPAPSSAPQLSEPTPISIPSPAFGPAPVSDINKMLSSYTAKTSPAPSKEDAEEENEPWYTKAWDWANKPLLDAHKLGTRAGAGPIETGIESGVEDLVSSLTSPLSIGLTVGTLGTGTALRALGVTAEEVPIALKGIKTLVDAGFTGQQVVGMVNQFPRMLDSLKEGDYQHAAELGTTLLASGALTAIGTKQLGRDAGALAEDVGVKAKPSEQMTRAREIAGKYDREVAVGGAAAQKLQNDLNTKFKALGIDKDEVKLGAIRKYMVANGDLQLLKDQHDALEGSLKTRVPDGALRIFRGTTPAEEVSNNETGTSYSTDKKIAEHFLNVKGPDGKIVTLDLPADSKLVDDDSYMRTRNKMMDQLARETPLNADDRFDKATIDTIKHFKDQGYIGIDFRNSFLGGLEKAENEIRLFDPKSIKPAENPKPRFSPEKDPYELSNTRFQGMKEADKKLLLDQYDAAQNLTPEEKGVAKELREFYDNQMDKAAEKGLIRQAVENYHPQAWANEQPSLLKRLFGPPIQPEENAAFNRLRHQTDTGEFDTNVNAAKHRTFQTEFEGEMAGYKPKTSDLAYHAANYQYNLEKAAAARNFIDGLRDHHLTTSDGVQPLVAMEGSSKAVGGEKPATFVNPNAIRGIQIKNEIIQDLDQRGQLQKLLEDGKIRELPFTRKGLNPETGEIEPQKVYAWDTAGYEPIGRAGRDWQYVGQDSDGKPVNLLADMRAHPEVAKYIRQIVGADPSVIAANPAGKALLAASREAKSTLLGLSPFHAVQLGLRSLMLGQLPTLKAVDFSDPLIQKGIENSLTFPGFKAKDQFMEGVSSHSKIINAIPGLRNVQNYINDFTFDRLMPSLKAQAFKAKYYDLLERMPDASSNEVARAAAEYVNDSFGGQNWRELGVSASSQDLMRAVALAPDWLTSEIRSLYRLTGGLGKEAGQLARADMTKFIAGTYITARVLNLLSTGKLHSEAPFGVVKEGKNGQDDTVYSLRTLPGDLLHAISDPENFIAGRINPLTIRPAIEGITKRDSQGHKVDVPTQAGDFLKNVVPIAGQTKLKQILGQATDLSNFDQVMKAAGSTVYKYRTEAEKLAVEKASDHNSSGPVEPDQLRNHMRNLRLEDGLRNGDISRAQIMRQLPKRDADAIIKDSKLNPLQSRFEKLPLRDALDVWELAQPSEKQLLKKQLRAKSLNYVKTHTPAQRRDDPTWIKMQKIVDQEHTGNPTSGSSSNAAPSYQKSSEFTPTPDDVAVFKNWGPTGPTNVPGMVKPGTVNLTNRPVVHRADGDVSSLFSASFGTDEGEVLVPLVSDDGKILSLDEAKKLYKDTGRSLGVFKTYQDADKYANLLHLKQGAFQTWKNGGQYKPSVETYSNK